MVLALLVATYRLCRLAMSGVEALAGLLPGHGGHEGWWPEGLEVPEELSPGLAAGIHAALSRILPTLHRALSAAKQAASPEESRAGLAEILALVEEAWALPAVGREVAKGLCDALRLEGGLDLLLSQLQAADRDTKGQAAQLLEQILVAENRNRVAQMGLGVVLSLARERDCLPLARSTAGILEHMFKHSEDTCLQLISGGGLDAILYWCRSNDTPLLRHCATALANCAMYGGPGNQRLMAEKRAPEWLFPLAFSTEDALVQFQACLAVVVLASNKEIEKEVEGSGTLALVEPFLAGRSPGLFARTLLGSSDNSQGRTADDLQYLVPLLDSSRLEAQGVATFYLCVEAAIKARQKKTEIFAEIGALQSLKRIVCYSPNGTTSSLAKQALRTMGEEVPRRLQRSVPTWKPPEVQKWLRQIGFAEYCPQFLKVKVDGDLLLRMTHEDLSGGLQMRCKLTRTRFLRELTELKTYASYSSCDRSNLSDWLAGVEPAFRQYTYSLVSCGIDRNSLHRVTEQQLLEDCGIRVGFHRARILSAAREMLHSPLPCSSGGKGASNGTDVFISYRRSTGSQLASLLKVHLQLHGFSVFLDVEKLEAGKFEDKITQSVTGAQNFVLVLSRQALDRCMGDTECKDWVHKEIALALRCGKNIIPVTDHFDWPDQAQLPEDMRAVLKFNGIRWSHEYQEATIEKLIRFLQGRSSRDSSTGSENSLECGPPLGQT
ncbi:Sterile alpha and TIR motif-containing protein 1 [Varanus komodoensis]|uniref:NAD(+) hydrolase SARM1 n=1 Tax=Varanus komodoensis TaxID=61221 RepID=UPI001CF76F96|nr:NAD(+) hydrolase SARM1 [Varanus komodoensis]KAF7244218.1 Sterile alpha and TIR motif-containing protein 1 [Varanus komodoensis]